jgi:hypothetical protein
MFSGWSSAYLVATKGTVHYYVAVFGIDHARPCINIGLVNELNEDEWVSPADAPCHRQHWTVELFDTPI